MSLWSSDDPQRWEDQLAGYAQAVAGLGKVSKEGTTLAELDRWFHDELPTQLSAMAESGKPARLNSAQLVKLVDWKLTRGKWRPRLLGFAKDLTAAQVESASQAALDVLAPQRGKNVPAQAIKEALDALCVLKGVGPATASAVLEAYNPSIPFLSDEAQQAALGSKDYTVKAVQQLASALQDKAKRLSAAGERQWTAKEVEQCLFASAAGGKEAGGLKPAAGGKRKSGGGQEAGAAGKTAGGSGSKRKR
ncbi:hypothetical protein ABPG77_001445 [Micractinium sp. CCAP 211/92]